MIKKNFLVKGAFRKKLGGGGVTTLYSRDCSILHKHTARHTNRKKWLGGFGEGEGKPSHSMQVLSRSREVW